MFDIVDTAFSYERKLIVCSFLQDFSKGKGSSLQLFCNAHTAFLLCTAAMHTNCETFQGRSEAHLYSHIITQRTTLSREDISSRECSKLDTCLLGKIEFIFDLESSDENT